MLESDEICVVQEESEKSDIDQSDVSSCLLSPFGNILFHVNYVSNIQISQQDDKEDADAEEEEDHHVWLSPILYAWM